MKYDRFSRRMFLQGANGFLFSIPYLTSLLPRELWAQSSIVQKRFITVINELDLGHNSNWIPRGATASFTNLPGPANQAAGYAWQPLSQFVASPTTPLARLYGTSLNNNLQYVNILRGLDFNARFGHGFAQILGSLQKNPIHHSNAGLMRLMSLDWFLSQNPKFNAIRKDPALIGYKNDEGDGLTIDEALNGKDHQNPFNEIYNMLFSNVPETTGDTTTPTTTQPHPRRAILNRVIEDYRRLAGHRNISSQDRATLNNSMDRFNDIFNQLPAGGTITPPSESCRHSNLRITSAAAGNTTTGWGYSRGANEDPIKGKLLADLMTAAIMCNVNSVFTCSFMTPYGWGTRAGDPGAGAELFAGDGDDNFPIHHRFSHTPWATYNGRPAWETLGNHQSLVFKNFIGPLVSNLASTVDPANNRPYLYNSLIFSTFGAGQTHSLYSHPAILIGNAGGGLTSGNYIDFSNRSLPVNGTDNHDENPSSPQFSNNYRGVSYNRLLVTILQAFGLQASDYERTDLNSRLYNLTNIGSMNNNLNRIAGYGHASLTSGVDAGSIIPYDLRLFGTRLPFPP